LDGIRAKGDVGICAVVGQQRALMSAVEAIGVIAYGRMQTVPVGPLALLQGNWVRARAVSLAPLAVLPARPALQTTI
jgi:hypothetical protein